MTFEIPLVSGHLRRETARDVDRTLRLQLVSALETVRGEVEDEQRRLAEARSLEHLGALGRLQQKIDKLVSAIKYAARGYRGLLDTYPLTEAKLERLLRFDEALRDEIEALHWKVESLHARQPGEAGLAEAIRAVDKAVDRLDRTFSHRADVLVADAG